MQIEGTETTWRKVKVEVGQREVFEQLMRESLRALGFDSGVYINKKGEAVYDEDSYGGSHSWTDTHKSKKIPTEKEIEIINAFHLVHDTICKVESEERRLLSAGR